MLYEIISEEFSNIDYVSFNKLFLEFGNTNKSQMPLMEMNKQFIRTIQQSFTTLKNQQTQNNHLSTPMPSRPQGARSKNVSFDEELELHRQHFQQFATPPPPSPPVFKDEQPQPSGDLSLLMQKAMNERKYDISSPYFQPQSQPQPTVRKLQIGSFVEDETHKEELIDIDKLANNIEQQPQKSAFDFFSKLKTVKKESEPEPETEPEPLIMRQETLIYSSTQNETQNTNTSTNTLEELTQKVERLTEEVQSLKELIADFSSQLSLFKNSNA